MSESEQNEPPIPDEGRGDTGEDYGAKASDDPEHPATEPEPTPSPKAE